MEKKLDVNDKMRAILIDWLVEVHLKFKLMPETLFLTVNLIDRYLAKEQINRNRLQLLGVSAMQVASKYEEIYPPIVKDMVYITDNAYTREEVLEMERCLLTALDFNISYNSQYRFLERIQKLTMIDNPIVLNLAMYVLELTLIQYKMLKYSPMILSAGAFYLSIRLTKTPFQAWNESVLG